MRYPKESRSVLMVMGGALIGAVATLLWTHAPIFTSLVGVVTVRAQGPANATPSDLARLQADVNRLKDLVPPQSHTMADVAVQYANLWFAGEKKNWPMAQFFVDETRSHIAWTVRIQPIRRNPDGSSVDIKAIFDAIDSSSLKMVRDAIAKQDSVQFASAYKTMLESCYACHKASARPFLRPMVPLTPPQPIINFDPNAKWPA